MQMGRLIILFFFIFKFSYSQVKILSWNIENLGKSKSDTTINFIVKTIKTYDVIALQEVVAGNGGAQAVAKIADELNRKGEK
jgi:deoxyribonuclease-1-like protein